jgi:hypothetical protein
MADKSERRPAEIPHQLRRYSFDPEWMHGEADERRRLKALEELEQFCRRR